MSGPADTIDINFLWHTQDVPDHVRGIMERAGKTWSYRLKDVFGSHQLTDGVVTRFGRDENGWAIPYYNDGLLVKSEFDSYSFGGFRTHQIDGDDFMTRSGYLVYSLKTPRVMEMSTPVIWRPSRSVTPSAIKRPIRVFVPKTFFVTWIMIAASGPVPR